MNRLVAFVFVITLGAALNASAAQLDIAAQAQIASCSGCHGKADGALPSLKQLSAVDVETAMLSFKNNSRAATLMDRIARGFTDDEIKAIAQWVTE